jgi:hypothetical protein
MRGIWFAAALTLLVGCAPTHGERVTSDDCVSHYEPVADAPTRPALKKKLLRDVDPRVRSLRVIDDDREDKVVVNLINRRNRLVMSLDMWQRDDGTWTARRWSQCID